jgi:hypothetical protein
MCQNFQKPSLGLHNPTEPSKSNLPQLLRGALHFFKHPTTPPSIQFQIEMTKPKRKPSRQAASASLTNWKSADNSADNLQEATSCKNSGSVSDPEVRLQRSNRPTTGTTTMAPIENHPEKE